ncbi:MAG: 1-(5-phosphoribosyl)-5-[(5-phosphoribosylamino)methylideneamino]imidazole-4-carboxamide isomerase [Clostridia bacterium]|nr:1-(5-phosphoribosyl)-5-[(5-phosphoribosylamino)methylideneamino]imidazole-4-carboxamide isomerase [Clostridia bacterium]
MIILPAIDILDGACVRLQKGAYETAHKVAADPMETAHAFEAAGADYIHMVDLNGAKDAKCTNRDLFVKVAAEISCPIELGGGIRTMEAVEYYLTHGISRVILGSAALRDPELVKRAAGTYGEKIAVGIDAKGGKVSVEGWIDTSDVDYIEFANLMESLGVGNIIFTDISRDGMLTGPNLDQLAALKDAISVDITASGGIKDIDDIRNLRDMKLYGAICGKSLYSGSLSLDEAIALCREVG